MQINIINGIYMLPLEATSAFERLTIVLYAYGLGRCWHARRKCIAAMKDLEVPQQSGHIFLSIRLYAKTLQSIGRSSTLTVYPGEFAAECDA